MIAQQQATLRRLKRQQGFTLMEVLVSMFVLTIGLVSMLGVFATAVALACKEDAALSVVMLGVVELADIDRAKVAGVVRVEKFFAAGIA